MTKETINWKPIKTEYITSNSTHKELAKKYGVSETSIAYKSRDEGWVNLRKEYNDKVQKKLVERETTKQADRYSRIMRISDQALGIIERKIKECEDTEGIKTADLRALTGAIRDLKEIQDCKGMLDIKEQEARINKLQADAEKDKEETQTVSVIFKGVDAEWLK